MRRLIAATLLLYPRGVRRRHGAELQSLVTDLIERDGASPPAVMTRLAADGLAQRLTSRTTAWVVAVTLVVTSVGGLAVSDFSAASARQREPQRAGLSTRTTAGTSAHRATPRRRRPHRTGIIDR